MSLRHEQGFTPLPSSQCWNMARQQATGSLGWAVLISSNFAPRMSNSSWSPSLCHFGVTPSMILIFFPLAVLSTDSFPRVGVASVWEEINKIKITLDSSQCHYITHLVIPLTKGSMWRCYHTSRGTILTLYWRSRFLYLSCWSAYIREGSRLL